MGVDRRPPHHHLVERLISSNKLPRRGIDLHNKLGLEHDWPAYRQTPHPRRGRRPSGHKRLTHAFDISITLDSTEAIACFDANRHQIAIIDWSLPALPGDQVARRFRQLHPASILVLTTGWDIEENYGNLDFFDLYLQKTGRPRNGRPDLSPDYISTAQRRIGAEVKDVQVVVFLEFSQYYTIKRNRVHTTMPLQSSLGAIGE